jgi:rhodanese-related sulfurtransferase
LWSFFYAAKPHKKRPQNNGVNIDMNDESIPEFDIPEITPLELAQRMQSEPGLILLDVREPYEVVRSKLADPRVVYAPLSELARKQMEALPASIQDRAAPLVVFCHMGQRSAQVTLWLMDLGWQNVVSLSGGIDAYARMVDPTMRTY